MAGFLAGSVGDMTGWRSGEVQGLQVSNSRGPRPPTCPHASAHNTITNEHFQQGWGVPQVPLPACPPYYLPEVRQQYGGPEAQGQIVQAVEVP